MFTKSELVDSLTKWGQNEKIYIWGTGVDGESAYNNINHSVEAFIDNYRSGTNTSFCSHEILSFDEFLRRKQVNDVIVIATYRFARDIANQLRNEKFECGKDFYIWDEQKLFCADDITCKFIAFMERIWSKHKNATIEDNNRILVPLENRHDTAAIVYSYFGNYFANKYSAKIYAYLRFGMMADDLSPVIKKIYQACNIDDFVDPVLSCEKENEAKIIVEELWEHLYCWADWNNIEVYGIHFGTTIIRHYQRIYIPTLDLRDEKMYNFLSQVIRVIVFWYYHINENNYKIVILGDGTNWDGYIRDIAISKGIPTYAMSYTMKKLKLDFYDFEPYKYFDNMWNQLSEQEQTFGIEWAKKRINDRLSGDTKGLAPLMCNSSAFVYEKKDTYVLNHNKKLKVVIFPHIFEEDSYFCGEQIFDNSYISWLCHLGELSNETPQYDWYLKIHPHARRRDEIIFRLIVENYPRIKIIAKDVSPFQLKAEGINVALTVAGTIGQEYPLLGIPVITAGQNPYSSFNFTINPKSKKEYDELIYNLDKIKASCDLEEVYKFYALNYLFYNWEYPSYSFFFEDVEMCVSFDVLEALGKQIGSWRYQKYMREYTEEKHKYIWEHLKDVVEIMDAWQPNVLYRKDCFYE